MLQLHEGSLPLSQLVLQELSPQSTEHLPPATLPSAARTSKVDIANKAQSETNLTTLRVSIFLLFSFCTYRNAVVCVADCSFLWSSHASLRNEYVTAA
jgi:hypothetical protein